MYSMVIFPSHHGALGSLIFKGAQGEILLGPVPIATPLPVSGESSDKPEEGVARLRVAGVVRMDGATPEDLRAFGRYGIIVLVSEKEAEKGVSPLEGVKDGLFIYGGLRETEELIECPVNAFRLMPGHHRKLVKLLDTGLPCSVQIMPGTSEEQAGMERKIAPAPVVGAQIARLAAAAAVVVVPFLVPLQARADDSGDSCCSAQTSSDSVVNLSTLVARQGGTQYTATVPNSSSGVTIAAGVDLGKSTEQDLVDMGFNEELLGKLSPYLAPSATSLLTGAKARRVLAANPLLVSFEEAHEINRLFITWHANTVGSLYNIRSSKLGQNGNFSQLPIPLQTTMTNMFLVDSSFRESDIFDKFASGDWPGGVDLLRTYKGRTPVATARAREAAEFLRKSILK